MFGQLDGQALRLCPADRIVMKNLTVNREHKFVLNVTTWDGETNSSAYSWFIGKHFCLMLQNLGKYCRKETYSFVASLFVRYNTANCNNS